MNNPAVQHLSNNDPRLAPVIAAHGVPTLKAHGNYYQELVESIISQQLSVKAAATIAKRFVALYGETFPAPEQILETSIDDLRAAGLSRPKAGYIKDLAQHVIDNTVTFDTLDQLSNDDIVKELTAVKGIGEWTVHMFLIFCMGRTDVLAYGDLGVRNGIKKLYGFDHVPDKDEVITIAETYNWHPYESIACWYIWKSLDNEPAIS